MELLLLMSKISITFALTGILVAGLSLQVMAQDSQQNQKSARRIAMALPKAPLVTRMPANTVVPARPKAVSVSPSINPQEEFASHPHVTTTQVGSKQIPDNVRAVLIEGASKAEQLSRGYNRRIADVIFWLASSINQSSTTITPMTSPNARFQNMLEAQPLKRQTQGKLIQID
jgi:hypothetical protein